MAIKAYHELLVKHSKNKESTLCEVYLYGPDVPASPGKNRTIWDKPTLDRVGHTNELYVQEDSILGGHAHMNNDEMIRYMIPEGGNLLYLLELVDSQGKPIPRSRRAVVFPGGGTAFKQAIVFPRRTYHQAFIPAGTHLDCDMSTPVHMFRDARYEDNGMNGLFGELETKIGSEVVSGKRKFDDMSEVHRLEINLQIPVIYPTPEFFKETA